MKTVICNNAWPYASGETLVVGQKYVVVRHFWRNGEGHFIVKRLGDGAQSSAPDVFFDDCRRN
jgi:hypothetical protein